MDKLTPLRMSLLIYSGILASALLALGSASSLTGMLAGGVVAGLFATGGQSVLYALAPLFIPRPSAPPGSHRRGGGGRLGAIERPAAARHDAGPRHRHRRGDAAASAPGILLAGVAVFWLDSIASSARPWSDMHPAASVKESPGRRPFRPRPPAPKVRHHSPDAYRPYGIHLPFAQCDPRHPPRFSRCP